jgi:hypothetical protein
MNTQETIEQPEGGAAVRSSDLLAEAVALLKEMHDRWGGVHDSNCDMIKSGRRKWGRIEPCSCTMGVRRMKFDAFMARYSANDKLTHGATP